MGRLHQAGQLFGGNQGDILGALAADNHHLLVVRNLLQNRGQPFPQTRICGLNRQEIPSRPLYSLPVRLAMRKVLRASFTG